MERKLYKSSQDKMLTGVCGGVAEYFGIDSTIVRLVMAFLTLWGIVPGIIIYIIAALVIPGDPRY